jgi:murein hydrolase activator
MHLICKHVTQSGPALLRLFVNALTVCLLSMASPLLFPVLLSAEDVADHNKEILSISEKETSIINELENLSRSLNTARQKSASIQKDIRAIDKQINENHNRSQILSKKINRNENYAYRRLVALYKLNQLGKLNLLASADTLYDFFQRKLALEDILEQDDKILTMLLKNQTELSSIRQKLYDQKKRKDTLQSRLSVQIVNASRKQKKRTRLLKEIRNKKTLTLAAIKSLKQSAEALDSTISEFKKENPGNRPYAGTSPHVFSDLKGLLIMPVKGKIVAFFGPYTNARFKIVNFRSGINIRSERGEPIHAVYKGNTLYANWFKGYGNMIIIDHGDHYYTLYAHAEELFKKKGDPVEAGEVIATVGDTGSLAKPGLHFEVRHHGQPIDPVPWMNQG